MNEIEWRKKPVVIEAMQVLDDLANHVAIRKWAASHTPEGEEVPVSVTAFDATLVIHTLEGDMRASLGDYIIRGVQGEFYPCKPDIFEATYERPDQPTEPVRCAPSREDLAAALKAHNFSRMTCLDHSHYGVSCDEVCHGVTDNQYLHHADAVQALYASQRTEAEVKAEAWEEAATWFDADLCGVSLIIRDRANRLPAAQPTPVFESMGLPTPEVPNVGGEQHG